jgi:hypothetical protein
MDIPTDTAAKAIPAPSTKVASNFFFIYSSSGTRRARSSPKKAAICAGRNVFGRIMPAQTEKRKGKGMKANLCRPHRKPHVRSVRRRRVYPDTACVELDNQLRHR